MMMISSTKTKHIPGSAGGLAPGNRTEGSTVLYKIVSPELPSIPFPVANPVAELGTYSALITMKPKII